MLVLLKPSPSNAFAGIDLHAILSCCDDLFFVCDAWLGGEGIKGLVLIPRSLSSSVASFTATPNSRCYSRAHI
jgi:hypothetical protein